MAEAGELAHLEILSKLNETANDGEIDKIVNFALPLQQAHVDAVREQSLRSPRRRSHQPITHSAIRGRTRVCCDHRRVGLAVERANLRLCALEQDQMGAAATQSD